MVGFEEGQLRLPSWQYAAAGATAGIITRTISQPLDVIKIRLQLQVEPVSKRNIGSKYQSAWHAAVSILREEGPAALWKGHNPGQLLSLSYGLLQFGTFEAATGMAGNFGWQGGLVDATCGALSGAMATLVSFPLDVLRTRLVAQPVHAEVYRSMWHGIQLTVGKEGVLALWRGLIPTLLQAAPHSAAQFSAYRRFAEIAKSLGLAGEDGRIGVLADLGCGGAAGAVAKASVYPLDLARKRLQLQGFESGRVGFGQNLSCNGLIDCLRKTYKGEGMAGLYKGLSASMLKAIVTTAFHFTSYHQVVGVLEHLASDEHVSS